MRILLRSPLFYFSGVGMKKNGNLFSKYKKELLAACEKTVRITDEYQKSLDTKKDRNSSVSEYYAFSEKLSLCVSLANSTAEKISEQILEADNLNDFKAKDDLNKLLEQYIYYRMYVEAFLKTAEEAKSSADLLRVLNHEADILARKIIAVSREI